MKKILVATDFSEASYNAFLYAVALAKDTGASIHLYHVYHSTQPIPESFLVYSSPDVWLPIKEKLEQMVNKATFGGPVHFTLGGDSGAPAGRILNEAALVGADLIVCGFKHKSPDLSAIFGSTATAVSKKTTIPLLIIPHNVIYHGIQHIALACDTDPDTRPQTVTFLRELTNSFSASLSVVLIADDLVTTKYDLLFQTMPFLDALKACGARIELSEGENITESLLNFSKMKQIDLLTVISHKHSIFDRLIEESVTRQLVFHTHIPLLILPQISASVPELKNTAEKEQETFYGE